LIAFSSNCGQPCSLLVTALGPPLIASWLLITRFFRSFSRHPVVQNASECRLTQRARIYRTRTSANRQGRSLNAAVGVGERRAVSPEPFHLAGGRWILHIRDMAVTLPIERMSRVDKLRAMEALWTDLSRDEARMGSPGWNGVILRETEHLIRDGKAKFSDWQVARRRIRRKAVRRT
jgi:hypothetical protein